MRFIKTKWISWNKGTKKMKKGGEQDFLHFIYMIWNKKSDLSRFEVDGECLKTHTDACIGENWIDLDFCFGIDQFSVFFIADVDGCIST